MSGHRERGHVRGSSDPLIVNRDPVVIERTPTTAVTVAAPRVSSETRTSTRPRSLTLYRVYNPFSRNRNSSNVIVETSVRRQPASGEGPSSSQRASGRRERRGSPPPPPVIHRRARSLSPSRTTTMPNPQGQPFVPLPPPLPTEEDRHARQRRESRRGRGERGRGGRESRQSQATEDVQIIDEPQQSVRRRSPRPYSHRPSGSDPRADQEQVIPPMSPGGYEYVTTTTNDPVRSREIRNSKEYRDLQAIATHNKRAAEDAAQRCSTAEIRLQNIQKQLTESTARETRAVEQSDRYRRESVDLRHELERTRAELEMLKREHRISSRERDVAEEQLSHERQQTLDRERERLAREDREREVDREREQERDLRRDRNRSRERPRDTSGSGSGNNTGNSGRTHHRRRRVVIQQDRSDRRDSEPRTTIEPRTSTVSAPAAASGDSGMDAINQARAEFARMDINRTSR